jgi:outer membrane protein assembly factor BamB
MRRFLPAVAVAVVLVFVGRAAAAESTSWLAYGHDPQLTNDVASTSISSRSAPRLQLAWTTRLDGPIVASPVSARIRIDGSEQQVIYVGTEAGSVYALASDGGYVLWHRTFATVATEGCGTYGFSSTGAIDAKRGVLYEIGADGDLRALDLATGDDRAGWPVQLITRTAYEYVWGGLQLIGDRLYVPVASYCDEPDPQGFAAQGRLVAVDPDIARVVATFDTVPGYGTLGGIWGWGGVATDATGSTLYTGVGNSYVQDATCHCYVDDVGYGDKIVALTPDLSQVLASNKPPSVPNTQDEDFGAAPLVFQPHGCPPLIAAKNKMGVMFVWNRAGIDAGPIASVGLGDGTYPFVGAPSYDPVRGLLFVTQAVVSGTKGTYGIAALKVGPGCAFRPAWRTPFGTGNQAPAIVVGDAVIAAGGTDGGFAALDAETGRIVWTYPTAAQTISPLIEVDGTVIGGDVDGNVYAFRIPACHRLAGLGTHACVR